jgi:hypothetical protein
MAAAVDIEGSTPTASAAPPITAAVTIFFMVDCPFRMVCASGALLKFSSAAEDATPSRTKLWTAHPAVDNSAGKPLRVATQVYKSCQQLLVPFRVVGCPARPR